MRSICSTVQCLTLFLLVNSAVSQLKVDVKSIWDVVEGQPVEIPVSADGGGTLKKQPMLVLFKNGKHGNKKITNTTDGRILVIEKRNGFKLDVLFKIKKVNITDESELGYFVKATAGDKKVNKNFNVYVLPKISIPVITISENQTGKLGSTVKFHCNATATYTSKPSLEVKWFHIFTEGGKAKQINDSYKNTKDDVGKKERIMSVLTVIVEQAKGGTYRCQATVKHGNGGEFNYHKDATLSVPVQLGSGMEPKQKIKVFQKKNAKLECKAAGYPVPVATWKKDGKPITAETDSRYRLSPSGNNHMVNGTFEIVKVDYIDRAVYTCTAYNGVSKVEVEFTLRVRDPLGPLWPFIGILVEAIVLAIIIVLYEKYKAAKQKKKADKGHKNTGNAGPEPPSGRDRTDRTDSDSGGRDKTGLESTIDNSQPDKTDSKSSTGSDKPETTNSEQAKRDARPDRTDSERITCTGAPDKTDSKKLIVSKSPRKTELGRATDVSIPDKTSNNQNIINEGEETELDTPDQPKTASSALHPADDSSADTVGKGTADAELETADRSKIALFTSRDIERLESEIRNKLDLDLTTET